MRPCNWSHFTYCLSARRGSAKIEKVRPISRRCLSHGKVNIFNLAKNAGTSVEQIERFYAKHLPLSREMAKNLQSFGEE